MQLLFIEALDTGLADEVGARIVALVEGLELGLIDAPHIPQGMRQRLGFRVVAQQLRLDLDAGQAIAIDGQTRDLLLTQFTHQQGGLVGALTLTRAFLEVFDFIGRQIENLDQALKRRLEITGAFAHDGEIVVGAVFGEQLTIAVIDQAARGRQGLDTHPVLVRARRIDVVFHDLQEEQPRQQTPGQHQHKAGSHDAAKAKDPHFLLRILYRRPALAHGGSRNQCRVASGRRLPVIGVPDQQCPGAVKLFCQHDAHQGVRQRQCRERPALIGTCQQAWVEPIRTTDEDGHVSPSQPPIIGMLGKQLGTPSLT